MQEIYYIPWSSVLYGFKETYDRRRSSYPRRSSSYPQYVTNLFHTPALGDGTLTEGSESDNDSDSDIYFRKQPTYLQPSRSIPPSPSQSHAIHISAKYPISPSRSQAAALSLQELYSKSLCKYNHCGLQLTWVHSTAKAAKPSDIQDC